jgi:hypothetical protein
VAEHTKRYLAKEVAEHTRVLLLPEMAKMQLDEVRMQVNSLGSPY